MVPGQCEGEVMGAILTRTVRHIGRCAIAQASVRFSARPASPSMPRLIRPFNRDYTPVRRETRVLGTHGQRRRQGAICDTNGYGICIRFRSARFGVRPSV